MAPIKSKIDAAMNPIQSINDLNLFTLRFRIQAWNMIEAIIPKKAETPSPQEHNKRNIHSHIDCTELISIQASKNPTKFNVICFHILSDSVAADISKRVTVNQNPIRAIKMEITVLLQRLSLLTNFQEFCPQEIKVFINHIKQIVANKNHSISVQASTITAYTPVIAAPAIEITPMIVTIKGGGCIFSITESCCVLSFRYKLILTRTIKLKGMVKKRILQRRLGWPAHSSLVRSCKGEARACMGEDRSCREERCVFEKEQ